MLQLTISSCKNVDLRHLRDRLQERMLIDMQQLKELKRFLWISIFPFGKANVWISSEFLFLPQFHRTNQCFPIRKGLLFGALNYLMFLTSYLPSNQYYLKALCKFSLFSVGTKHAQRQCTSTFLEYLTTTSFSEFQMKIWHYGLYLYWTAGMFAFSIS